MTVKPPVAAMSLSAARPEAYDAGVAVPVKASTSNVGPVPASGWGSGDGFVSGCGVACGFGCGVAGLATVSLRVA